MTTKWSYLRNQAVLEGRLDEQKVSQHKRRLLAEVRALKLAEIRNTYGHAGAHAANNETRRKGKRTRDLTETCHLLHPGLPALQGESERFYETVAVQHASEARPDGRE